MSLHLQKFIDRVRGFESRGAKEFIMSLQDAKDMHADITRLLLELQTLRESVHQKTQEDEVLVVKMDGGSFKM
jgi:DNA primase